MEEGKCRNILLDVWYDTLDDAIIDFFSSNCTVCYLWDSDIKEWLVRSIFYVNGQKKITSAWIKLSHTKE